MAAPDEQQESARNVQAKASGREQDADCLINSLLTPELLCQVLIHACKSHIRPWNHWSPGEVHRLKGVCRHWRDIIDSSPEFWETATLHVRTGKTLLERRYKVPGTAPHDRLAGMMQLPQLLHKFIRDKGAWMKAMSLFFFHHDGLHGTTGAAVRAALQYCRNLQRLGISSSDDPAICVTELCSNLTTLSCLSVAINTSMGVEHMRPLETLANLEEIFIVSQALEGDVFEVLSKLPKLRSVMLSYNNGAVHEDEPVDLDSLTVGDTLPNTLEHLILKGPDQAHVPAVVMLLTALTALKMLTIHPGHGDDMPVERPSQLYVPANLNQLSNLAVLQIDDVGDGSIHVTELRKLTHLVLRGHFTAGPQEVPGDDILLGACCITGLVTLALKQCNITRVPPSITQLTSLQHLDLKNNPMIGSMMVGPFSDEVAAPMHAHLEQLPVPQQAAAQAGVGMAEEGVAEDALNPAGNTTGAQHSTAAVSAGMDTVGPGVTLVPRFVLPPSARYIRLWNCGLEKLPAWIREWHTNIDHSEMSRGLVVLDIGSNPLKELPAGRYLECVEALRASKCSELEKLPNSSKQPLQHLFELDFKDSPNLPVLGVHCISGFLLLCVQQQHKLSVISTMRSYEGDTRISKIVIEIYSWIRLAENFKKRLLTVFVPADVLDILREEMNDEMRSILKIAADAPARSLLDLCPGNLQFTVEVDGDGGDMIVGGADDASDDDD